MSLLLLEFGALHRFCLFAVAVAMHRRNTEVSTQAAAISLQAAEILLKLCPLCFLRCALLHFFLFLCGWPFLLCAGLSCCVHCFVTVAHSHNTTSPQLVTIQAKPLFSPTASCTKCSLVYECSWGGQGPHERQCTVQSTPHWHPKANQSGVKSEVTLGLDHTNVNSKPPKPRI